MVLGRLVTHLRDHRTRQQEFPSAARGESRERIARLSLGAHIDTSRYLELCRDLFDSLGSEALFVSTKGSRDRLPQCARSDPGRVSLRSLPRHRAWDIVELTWGDKPRDG
jgi:hypothetical protein